MANPRDRFWTTAEIAIVREHYPHGGIDACVPLLSKRSRSSIYQRAGKLKLRAPGQPALRQSWKPDADIDARIVWLHQRPMGRGAILEFAARISRPQWWVSKRARELGLKTPRFKESPWSEAELALLHETSHLSAKQARIRFVKAGFTRSETAIHVMRKRQHISVVQARQDAGFYTGNQLAELFGVDPKTITRWIRIGELEAARNGENFSIRESALREFIITCPLRIELRKIPDSNRTWFIQLLAGKAGISVERAA
jgi:excisionase family DNA binding protein